MPLFLLLLALVCAVSSIIAAAEGHLRIGIFIAMTGIFLLGLSICEWLKEKEDDDGIS